MFVRVVSALIGQWLGHSQVGGNANMRAAFAEAGVSESMTISQRYGTNVAEIYRERIAALSRAKLFGCVPPTHMSLVARVPVVLRQRSALCCSCSSRVQGGRHTMHAVCRGSSTEHAVCS